MQADATSPLVEQAIQRAQADESMTELRIDAIYDRLNPPPLTAVDAQHIVDCLLRESNNPNPSRFDTLILHNFDMHNVAMLKVLRDGLLTCPSVTNVVLRYTNLGNEQLEILQRALSSGSSSVTSLEIYGSVRTPQFHDNSIQGQRGGEAIRHSLAVNSSLDDLNLTFNTIGPEGAIGLGQGLAINVRLQKLILCCCMIGNQGLDNLVLSMGKANNSSLLHLDLSRNNIQGADGGRQVSLLLQRFTALNVLQLHHNNLGASALAPGLAAASHLESLVLYNCGLGNDEVANLIPDDGQVNRSLTHLDLSENNIQGADGGSKVSLLLQRFLELKVLNLNNNPLLGPLGARALAPGLTAAASKLESLDLEYCGLGNDSVANLVPEGQVNMSLTHLDLRSNDTEGTEDTPVGGENVVALASRCTNLDRLDLYDNVLSPDQQCRLNMLFNRSRLCTAAQAFGGSQ